MHLMSADDPLIGSSRVLVRLVARVWHRDVPSLGWNEGSPVHDPELAMSSTRTMIPVVGGLSLPEAPRWHDGDLYVSDTFASRIIKLGDDGSVETCYDGGGAVLGGIGWLDDGTLLIVDMAAREIVAVDPDGERRLFADCSQRAPFWINDLLVHPAGFGFVSQMGFDITSPDFEAVRDGDAASPPLAALLRVDRDGSVHDAASGMFVANNIALSADGETLFVAETGAKRVTAFTVGAAGELSDRRVFADLSHLRGPDGLCVDAEGALWVAVPELRTFTRYREGGEVADEIVLPEDRLAVACVLGGPDRRTLYLLHIDQSGPMAASTQMDGRVGRVTVDVAGAGLP